MTNAISYTMRTNLNLTIVAMVKKPNNHSIYETCLRYNESITSLQESDARILKQKHQSYQILKIFVFFNIAKFWWIWMVRIIARRCIGSLFLRLYRDQSECWPIDRLDRSALARRYRYINFRCSEFDYSCMLSMECLCSYCNANSEWISWGSQTYYNNYVFYSEYWTSFAMFFREY